MIFVAVSFDFESTMNKIIVYGNPTPIYVIKKKLYISARIVCSIHR